MSHNERAIDKSEIILKRLSKKNIGEQAGAELCQAQRKLALTYFDNFGLVCLVRSHNFVVRFLENAENSSFFEQP